MAPQWWRFVSAPPDEHCRLCDKVASTYASCLTNTGRLEITPFCQAHEKLMRQMAREKWGAEEGGE